MYDARDQKLLSNAGDLIFGAAVIAVVGGAFLIGWLGPKLINGGGPELAGGATSPPAASAQAEPSGPLADAFKDRRGKRYLALLRTVEPAAYDELEGLVAASDGDKTAQRETLMLHASELAVAEAAVLAKADVRHFDAILERVQTGLRDASASNSKLCKGSFYSNLDAASITEMNVIADKFSVDNDDIYAAGMDFNILLLEALADARANPRNYGKLSRQDEAAVQGVFMSLLSDPQFMGVMAAAQSNERDALRRIDVCQVANTVVSAFKTLPQDTKGRVWADALGGGGALRGLGGL